MELKTDTIADLEKKLVRSSGKMKLETLIGLSDILLEIKPRKCIRYAKIAIEYAAKSNYKIYKAKAFHNAGNAHNKLGNYRKASELLLSAAITYRHIKANEELVTCLYDLGTTLECACKFPDALDYYQQASSLSEKYSSRKLSSLLLMSLGRTCAKLANYEKALEYLSDASRLLAKLNDKENTATVFSYFGNIYSELGDLENALKYHKKALINGESIQGDITIAKYYNNIGVDYGDLGKFGKALEYHKKALRIRQNKKAYHEAVLSLNNIGVIYEKQKKYDESLKYFKEAYTYKMVLRNKHIEAIILSNIGSSYTYKGQTIKALKYLKKALTIVKKFDLNHELISIYTTMSELYSRRKNYKKALYYSNLVSQTKDNIFNEKLSGKVIEFQVQVEIQKKEQEKRQLQQKLYYLNKETVMMAENLAQRNETIAKLERELSGLKGIKHKTKFDLKRALDFKSMFNIHREWRQFKDQFEKLYPGFQAKLNDKYPTLTNQEMKICMLIKLQLSTTNISKVLFTSKRTIENHRYRLRKKLMLEAEDDIFAFLDSLN
ncbi:MAG: tetratricopeptide repeat protein [candidate division Zixibacteria bacterium]|nr:tetratricopeptide repeat protein [candidate division Zixibacteria bacterium]